MFLPASLLESLEGIEGYDRNSFEKIHLSGQQVTSIRLNPFKSFSPDSSWETSPVSWCPQGYYLSERPSFTLDPRFHAGAYYVQEASSMFLWQVLKDIYPGSSSWKVLDLCAAPGGKTTLLGSFFKEGLVVANEVIKSRAAVLVENLTKWGTDQIIITNNDPAHFQSLPGYFDLMLVDAPCSGSGLFRKDPSAVIEWSIENVALCSQRQKRILGDALPSLKEDGILIYATCSYSPEEDEEIADWLVGEMDMENIPIHFQPEWGIVETTSRIHQARGYRFYPDKLKGEGFFTSVFKKRSSTQNPRLKEFVLPVPSRQEMMQVAETINLPEAFTLFKQSETIRTIRKEWLLALQCLAKQLYIKKAGVEIGTLKGKDLIPAHELALSLLPLDCFPSVELSRIDALQYLRRKEIVLDTTYTGWSLVRFEGLPLGWVKILTNRVNNYYPAEWRILKE